jgi:sugar phosphate isomerase/epimerase
MDRREFLHTSFFSVLAGSILGGTTLARAAQASSPSAAAPPPARRLILDAYSRNLHWLRNYDEVAEAAIELTCAGVQPTVQEHPGHVNPANVAQELPAFVKTMQKHGLRVKQVRGGNQTDVAAPHVEAIVGTMGQLGVTHYWMGTDNYDLSKPIMPQLDAIKVKVERFVKLNQKHGTTLMYHTRAGANSVGSVVWDLLYVMKDFDPKSVGFHWDTGHMALHGANMWELLMRTAGPYVVAMSWKDRSWQQNPGLKGEGGPSPAPAAADAGQARPGGQGAAAGGGRGSGGRGGGPPRPPGADTFAGGGRWSSPHVPLGTGLVDILRYATVMRDIGFDGPMELQAEYPNGGSESGRDTLTLPRAEVLGNLKRDVLAIRAGLQRSGTGLTI